MRMLSTFFPTHQRPRTVVHAGPLLLSRADGERLLKRYLRIPRERQVFLVHRGRESLRDLAKQAGVDDIRVDTTDAKEADVATEMALALGAGRLDFSIDEPGVIDRHGETLGAIGLRDAEALARDPSQRPRIRAKLRAGCAAVRTGVVLVRIGDPTALAADRATVLAPDEALSSSTHSGAQWPPARERVAAARGGARA